MQIDEWMEPNLQIHSPNLQILSASSYFLLLNDFEP